MPVQLSRRAALAGLGVGAASLAVGTPTLAEERAAATPLAKALAVPSDTVSVALWGSSSMEGGLGEEHTPRPVFVHEELANSFNPRQVHNVAYGAQASGHTAILRGVDRPYVHIPAGYRGGEIQVRVDARVAPLWSFTCHGRLGEGEGVLRGKRGSTSWFFEADTGSTPTSGEFLSSWWESTKDSRHVIWTGKNNIIQRSRVIDDITRIAEAARDPERDVIVMGQWVTRNDLDSPERIAAMRAVNEHQRSQFDERFLDVQEVLTSPEWLSSEPLSELGLLRRESTERELELGIVPDPLRGTDGVHLSGWGNLLVSWALVQKMKELRWL